MIQHTGEVFCGRYRRFNPHRSFKALAVFDQRSNEGNENGSIDPNDGVFRRLQFWRDENHNGVSEFEELIPFPNTRIESIDLDYKPSKKVDQYGQPVSLSGQR